MVWDSVDDMMFDGSGYINPRQAMGRGIRPTKRNNDPKDFAFKLIGDDKSVKLPSCHYTDERFRNAQTIFGRRKKRGGYSYDDRFPQQNYDKWQAAHKHAASLDVADGSVFYYEAVLSYFLDKETVIDHVLTGFNWSSGYSFYVFGHYHPRGKA